MGYVDVAVVVALAVVLVSGLWQLGKTVLWRPYSMTRIFKRQGIKGPPYSLLYGSLDEMKKLRKGAAETVLDKHSNDLIPRVLPHYHKWCEEYGEMILYWYGTQPRITISDPELAKQVLSNKFGFYVKPSVSPSVLKLIGRGLFHVDGAEWARHKRILNPAFSMDTLKVMTKRMAACTINTLEEWKNRVAVSEDNSIKIEMNDEFQRLTTDIIAHTAFGSSYAQGKEAFKAQKALQKSCAALNIYFYIPGSQYFPTQSNLEIWKLNRKLKNSLRQIIEGKIKSLQANTKGSHVDDLLGLMLGASENADSGASPKLDMDEIIEECKTFFFAGQDTTSSLLVWTIFLLSVHRDWQERLRHEVLKECGSQVPDADKLSKLKLVNMVLHETLRLYCPAIELVRKAAVDIKLGDLVIPKGTFVVIPITKIHRSKDYWGEDANEFNPLRFVNGVSKAAKHPNALLGFSIGPRACIGQNFAMLEAKTVLAVLLQRFSFTLSPEYKHAPTNYLSLQPQFGLPVVVKPLPSQVIN